MVGQKEAKTWKEMCTSGPSHEIAKNIQPCILPAVMVPFVYNNITYSQEKGLTFRHIMQGQGMNDEHWILKPFNFDAKNKLSANKVFCIDNRVLFPTRIRLTKMQEKHDFDWKTLIAYAYCNVL